MRIETLDQATSLVGTTWQRDGSSRTIKRIDSAPASGRGMRIFRVAYQRNNCGRWTYSSLLRHFNDWLDGAEQVT